MYVQVETLETEVQEGDTLLLCSDGLHSLVTDEEIAQVLAGGLPQASSQALVDRANAQGGTDNITVIVAQVDHARGQSTTAVRRGRDDAKTVQVKTQRGTRRPARVWRLLLTLLLLPLKLLLLWPLKLLGRGLRLLLRPLRRR